MKVILLQDVPNVGRKNEVKEVNSGFARNFLLARKLAIPATEGTVQKINQEKEQKEKAKSKKYEEGKKLVEKLKSLTLNFKVKIGEKGKSFGSVTETKIVEALKKLNFNIDKDWILLEEHIKTTGDKVVKIKFPQGLVGEIKIKVEAE